MLREEGMHEVVVVLDRIILSYGGAGNMEYYFTYLKAPVGKQASRGGGYENTFLPSLAYQVWELGQLLHPSWN